MNKVNEPRYCIGQKYVTSYGKQKRNAEVVDILKTYNSAGELVKVRYVSKHDVAGQTVYNYDECDSTIARGIAY